MEKSETACIPLPNRGKCNFKEMMKNQGVGGGGEVGGGGGGGGGIKGGQLDSNKNRRIFTQNGLLFLIERVQTKSQIVLKEY